MTDGPRSPADSNPQPTSLDEYLQKYADRCPDEKCEATVYELDKGHKYYSHLYVDVGNNGADDPDFLVALDKAAFDRAKATANVGDLFRNQNLLWAPVGLNDGGMPISILERVLRRSVIEPVEDLTLEYLRQRAREGTLKKYSGWSEPDPVSVALEAEETQAARVPQRGAPICEETGFFPDVHVEGHSAEHLLYLDIQKKRTAVLFSTDNFESTLRGLGANDSRIYNFNPDWNVWQYLSWFRVAQSYNNQIGEAARSIGYREPYGELYMDARPQMFGGPLQREPGKMRVCGEYLEIPEIEGMKHQLSGEAQRDEYPWDEKMGVKTVPNVTLHDLEGNPHEIYEDLTVTHEVPPIERTKVLSKSFTGERVSLYTCSINLNENLDFIKNVLIPLAQRQQRKGDNPGLHIKLVFVDPEGDKTKIKAFAEEYDLESLGIGVYHDSTNVLNNALGITANPGIMFAIRPYLTEGREIKGWHNGPKFYVSDLATIPLGRNLRIVEMEGKKYVLGQDDSGNPKRFLIVSEEPIFHEGKLYIKVVERSGAEYFDAHPVMPFWEGVDHNGNTLRAADILFGAGEFITYTFLSLDGEDGKPLRGEALRENIERIMENFDGFYMRHEIERGFRNVRKIPLFVGGDEESVREAQEYFRNHRMPNGEPIGYSPGFVDQTTSAQLIEAWKLDVDTLRGGFPEFRVQSPYMGENTTDQYVGMGGDRAAATALPGRKAAQIDAQYLNRDGNFNLAEQEGKYSIIFVGVDPQLANDMTLLYEGHLAENENVNFINLALMTPEELSALRENEDKMSAIREQIKVPTAVADTETFRKGYVADSGMIIVGPDGKIVDYLRAENYRAGSGLMPVLAGLFGKRNNRSPLPDPELVRRRIGEYQKATLDERNASMEAMQSDMHVQQASVRPEKLNMPERDVIFDFEMWAPDGKKVKLSNFRKKGKPTIVVTWATYCGPCQEHAFMLFKMKEIAEKHGITFILLNGDGQEGDGTEPLSPTDPKIEEFRESYGLNIPTYTAAPDEMHAKFEGAKFPELWGFRDDGSCLGRVVLSQQIIAQFDIILHELIQNPEDRQSHGDEHHHHQGHKHRGHGH